MPSACTTIWSFCSCSSDGANVTITCGCMFQIWHSLLVLFNQLIFFLPWKHMEQNNQVPSFAGPHLHYASFPLMNALSRWQRINFRNRIVVSCFLAPFISSIQPSKHFKIPVNPILECPNYSSQSTFVPGRRIKITLTLNGSRRSPICSTVTHWLLRAPYWKLCCDPHSKCASFFLGLH